mmetsp:Transcript_1599/g.2275  ORF Transcript_1599/g.2275 Transcript_1599/m.2275 type:complete len:162 (+) Transcript_1599:125-610(+)|eukprot:CAMPEP_0184863020 /NCGR_PEP_ID=MMETSP0580-20130426/8350_1 /TAXON_ID=1118495 /ORGANISM="Dactyliosolen fragilissimus" /LENGTH=161 /DNA_ID=CAMNT_0027361063 /DNA_START=72 /DNA_END=557 /DNA_ORIENTATION=+
MASVSSLLFRSTASLKSISRVFPSASFASHGSAAARFSTYFTPAHEYAHVDDKIATCGITDFAQSALGDIVFVDLPEVGDEFENGESFGSVESVKAASDVYAPVSGTIVEINDVLSDEPGIVNESPEKDGWFVKIKMSEEGELSKLMLPDEYKEHCEKEAH